TPLPFATHEMLFQLQFTTSEAYQEASTINTQYMANELETLAHQLELVRQHVLNVLRC
ncbi:7281_t:CDS:1, partial [Racocetra fulgida]